jgi:PST family polysaccharide transporter
MVDVVNRLVVLFHRIRKAEIIKVFSFTSIATLIKMLTGLVSVKVVSIIVGPAGIALIGQLNSFMSIVYNLASGGINSGITKYISENREDVFKAKSLISTAFRITLCCSLVIGINLVLFHKEISQFVMLAEDYGYIFVILGFTICFCALNNLFISILNGYKMFRLYVNVNIITSFIGLLFMIPCVYFGGLKGALISTVTYQSIIVFATLLLIRKLPWVKFSYFASRFDKKILIKYLHYTIMTFTAVILLPVSQLFLRRYVISNISSVEAGWWEAMNRISGIYLMIITSSFGVYYLPRLSELTDRKGLQNEIFKAYKIIVPVLIIGLTAVYLLRSLIIRLVFTAEFLPMANLFIWQLMGDFFKISSWLLAYIMAAKAMTVAFVATEMIFTGTFTFFAFLLVGINGIVGITQAYLINYIIYLLSMIFLFKNIIFYKDAG